MVLFFAATDNRLIPSSPKFAGKLAQCYGNGCKAHASTALGQPWFTDYFGWDGSYYNPYDDKLVLKSGHVYEYVKGTFPLNPKHFAIAGSGPYVFTDVSPAALDTASAGSYTFCVANAANECYGGSTEGQVYVNLPGTPMAGCTPNGPCIVNFNPFAAGIVQIGISGTATRVLSNGLVGLRDTNDYPTAKTLPDGSWILFTVGDTAYHTPSQLLMVRSPPFTAGDSVDRSTFVRAPISISAPQGLGIASAAVEFGYTEQGEPSQYYCTSRREACVAVSATVNDATPFHYAQTETYTRMPCAKSCTITLPVLPAHVAYYQVKFYDARGVVVTLGDKGVSVEATAVKPGVVSANAYQ